MVNRREFLSLPLLGVLPIGVDWIAFDEEVNIPRMGRIDSFRYITTTTAKDSDPIKYAKPAYWNYSNNYASRRSW